MTSTPIPLVLIILDGFGHSESHEYNAIYSATTVKDPMARRVKALNARREQLKAGIVASTNKRKKLTNKNQAADRVRGILSNFKMLQEDQIVKTQTKLLQAGIRAKDLAYFVIAARFVAPLGRWRKIEPGRAGWWRNILEPYAAATGGRYVAVGKPTESMGVADGTADIGVLVRVLQVGHGERAGIDRVDVLGIERQPAARQPVGNAAMHRAHTADRGEQAKHAAVRGLDQPGIGAGQRGQIAARDVGDDQHLGARGIVERACRLQLAPAITRCLSRPGRRRSCHQVPNLHHEGRAHRSRWERPRLQEWRSS